MVIAMIAPMVSLFLVAPSAQTPSLTEGLECVAKGDFLGAEPLLRKQAEQSAGKPFVAATETLPPELTRLRVHFTLDAGEAAAWNNLGAVLLLLGKPQEAMEALDKAAGLQPEWGAPWANSALVWLAKKQPGKADEIGRTALIYGARTANLYATLAEASLSRRNSRQAEEYIRRALELEAGHGYATYVRTQIHEQQGKFAEAERDLLQALSQNGFVANGFHFAPSKVEPGVGGGGKENWQFLGGVGFQAGMGGNLQLLRDVGSVEGESGIDQRLNQGRLVLGKMRPRGDTLLSALRREQSDTRLLGAGVSGRTGLAKTQLDLLQSVRFSPTSEVKILGRWRQSEADLRSQASGARYSPVRDKQLSGEAQWQRGLTKNLGLQVGGAWLQNERVEGAPQAGTDLAAIGYQAATQPFEQVFLPGTTNLWTAHALLRYPVLGRTLTLGPVFGSQAGAPGIQFTGKKVTRAAGVPAPAYSGAFLPYADWAYPTPGGKTLHLSVTPQVGSTATAFAPGDASRVLQPDSLLPGLDGTGNRLGARTLYYGAGGNGVSYELGLRQEEKNGLTWETTAFQRELRNVGTASDDPRIDPTLGLVPWSRTHTRGMEANASYRLARAVRVSSFVRYQEAKGTLADDERQELSLSNAPRWQGSVHLDWNPNELTRFGVQTLVEGTRSVTLADVVRTGVFYRQEQLPSVRRYALYGGTRLRQNQELNFSVVVPEKGFWQGSNPETVFMLGLGARR